ncbi:MAG: GMP synthase (glutamine-hydrolyzing) [Kiritimatiellia bacterium]|jgi:GMP synthase (glutamine-hydrolysing)
MKHHKIAVVDFGGQYAHLIATKVRRAHVLAEILQPEAPIEDFAGFDGIIISGSPSLASQGEDSAYNKAIFELDVPILGFCFGHQEIAKYYGGMVVHGGREWGHADLHIIEPHPLFEGLQPVEQVWMSHFDSVTKVGPSFKEIGWSTLGKDSEQHRFAAIASDDLRRYGMQYHPEVDGTANGDRMICNFVLNICGCEPTWTMNQYVSAQLEQLKQEVGDRPVFLLASGGVDSTVAAVLLARALPPGNLSLLHVDNGLMRKDESRQVLEMFADLGLADMLHFVDATDDFLQALEGLVQPEAKRRAIGDTFVAVFEREAKKHGLDGHLLGQGTIYPDTVETGGTKRAHVIKTHHNRVPIIQQMIEQGRVVEPLADLYKVEVRELGEQFGIAREALWRHPFPGPGLGVRLLCSNGVADPYQGDRGQVSAIAARFGLNAIVLPIRSVGVKADLRVYEHPVLLTGDVSWSTLMEAVGAITREAPGINRCLWNLSADAPSEATPVASTMVMDRLDLLREADDIVMNALVRHDLYDAIWQCPTAMVPLQLDGVGCEMVVLRPVHSKRAMAAQPVDLPIELLAEVRAAISALSGISGVTVDLTSKPPGTIEWE